MNHPLHPIRLVPDGEIMGSMLIGLVRAFKNIQAISGDQAAYLVEDVESSAWYPMAQFFNVLDKICRRDLDYGPILFQAGMAVSEDWYHNGGGRERVSYVKDFLRMQEGNGGYTQVHRGDPEKIGWQEVLEADEEGGRAVFLFHSPYPPEYERGIIHGGLLMAGDIQYAESVSVEEPYNRHLSRKTLTLRFRKKTDEAAERRLDALLEGMAPDRPVVVPPELSETLAWRLKSLDARYRSEQRFHQQSSLLLSRAASDIHALSQKLDKLAHHDELTGLLNRRSLLKGAHNLLALSIRLGWPMAFIMIDIDHFKTINDTWGHGVGDEALRAVAALLRGRLRDSDLVGRIGGEEFLVVLPNANLQGALEVAEGLRAGVADLTSVSAGEEHIPLTISLGVAVVEGERGDVDRYVRQADQALYQAKRDGRNRVVSFAP